MSYNYEVFRGRFPDFEFDLRLFAKSTRNCPPAVIVASHERSGTHFLMNSLAQAYGYVSAPWTNIDTRPFNINFHQPDALSSLLVQLARRRLASVGKTHHAAEFFAPEIETITKSCVIFYIYRDPAEVMLSLQSYLMRWSWDEGPKIADPLQLARAEPSGRMLRYQARQQPSMVARWADHVTGWLRLAKGNARIIPVRYEQLNADYAQVMRGFSNVLGRDPINLKAPARDANVISGSDQIRFSPEEKTNRLRELRSICLVLAGESVRELGYGGD